MLSGPCNHIVDLCQTDQCKSSIIDCINKQLFVCFRDKVLVCPMKSAPVLLTLSDCKHVVLPVDDDSDLNVVAAFDRRGEYIYTGNAKGKVSRSVSWSFSHTQGFSLRCGTDVSLIVQTKTTLNVKYYI